MSEFENKEDKSASENAKAFYDPAYGLGMSNKIYSAFRHFFIRG